MLLQSKYLNSLTMNKTTESWVKTEARYEFAAIHLALRDSRAASGD